MSWDLNKGSIPYIIIIIINTEAYYQNFFWRYTLWKMVSPPRLSCVTKKVLGPLAYDIY